MQKKGVFSFGEQVFMLGRVISFLRDFFWFFFFVFFLRRALTYCIQLTGVGVLNIIQLNRHAANASRSGCVYSVFHLPADVGQEKQTYLCPPEKRNRFPF